MLDEVLSRGIAGRLDPGAEVDVIAPAGAEVVENIGELVLAGRRVELSQHQPSDGPYRRDQTERGLLLRGTHAMPLVIRLRT